MFFSVNHKFTSFCLAMTSVSVVALTAFVACGTKKTPSSSGSDVSDNTMIVKVDKVGDSGFRFRGGICVRVALADGDQVLERGYNLKFKGECGDFSNQNLQKAKFAEMDLTGANFDGADLSGANFNRSILDMASFKNAKLHGTSFESATLISTNLADADMTAKPEFNRGDAATFKQANLRHANFANALMTGTSVWGADLRRTNLSGAVLKNVDARTGNFIRSNLTGADFSNAMLLNVHIDNPYVNQFTKIDRESMFGFSLGTFEAVDANALP